ncbi:hypothetical protein NYP18_00060 [Corynebacterium sp. YIM 101645]|uniref:Cytosine permease n=1 Tax=Corynebacterium lemuris TaxID=1859292 RepID=A0ABT2FSF7_9CORY|nr:hypothetical protein [Corynebacterium lemuris]MCS5478046.1 hypothetical protein [Corynebacterium lemuris]
MSLRTPDGMAVGTQSIDSSLAAAAEDHALVRVPQEERKGGWYLALSPVSVATALVLFAIGGFAVVLAGFKVGLITGLVIAVIGAVLGKTLSMIAFRSGVSSTITSRFFGFGQKGSVFGSAIFAFMIIGFLAMESALLYEGTLLMFGWSDSWLTRILLYGALTLAWIALAIFGLKVALRSSLVMIVITLAVALYMVIYIYGIQGNNPMDVFNYTGVVEGGFWAKFSAAFAVMGATAGTISLVTMDFARYARTQRDVTILALAGPLVQNILMLVLGALIVIGGMPQVIDYLMARDAGLTPEAAAAAAGGFVMSNTGAFFVIFAGWIGFITIYASQAKAQAINAYSGSLSLVNMIDALTGWSPGRAVMVVVANIIGLLMIGAGILHQFAAYLAYLGCWTLAMSAIMIADYFFVRRHIKEHNFDRVENWNWAGLLTLVASSVIGMGLMYTGIFDLGFIISGVLALVLYPALRKLLPEGTGTTFTSKSEAMVEAL